MEQPVQTIGHQIKIARTIADMTRRQLADIMGVTVSAVSRWERNDTTPTGQHLLALIAALPSLDAGAMSQAGRSQ